MQKVIELGRYFCERCIIGFKQFFKMFIVIYYDLQYLEDVWLFQDYIIEEFNICDIVLILDEVQYGVQYSVMVDWFVFGKKFKKDMGKVKKVLLSVISEEVYVYIQIGKLVVDGIIFEVGDLVVKCGLKEDEFFKNLEINIDNDVFIIFDVEIYFGFVEEGFVCEIINRVQRLCKKVGFQVIDDIKMEYRVFSDFENIGLEKVFEFYNEIIIKVLWRLIDKYEVIYIEGQIFEKKEEGIIVEEE